MTNTNTSPVACCPRSFVAPAGHCSTCGRQCRYPTLDQAKAQGKAWLEANPTALEIEYTVRVGSVTMQVWVDRAGDAYDRSRYA